MPIPTAPPSGFRDFLPEQVALRQTAMAAITKVYKSFGFQPIQTSAVEDLAVLTGQGGGENEKLIFKIMKRGEALERAQAEKADLADLGLRFDLTLPLARYYTKHGSLLPHPFKALQMGPVWRAERAQKGRYREFTQCDVDIIGSDSWGAEVEVITAILTVFSTLGLTGVKVHLNDRALVQHLLSFAAVPSEQHAQVCIELDKLDKIGVDGVRTELTALIGEAKAKSIEDIFIVNAAHVAANEEKSAALTRRLELISHSVKTAFPNAEIVSDRTLMRGMGYYTGPVFEFRHASLSGSLGGGGRYDKLTEKFGGQPIPACGGSIGFERLMIILEEMGKHAASAAPDAVVTVFSDELRGRSLDVAAALRAKGLSVDVFPGGGKLKGQFKYADQKKAAYALVIGPDEAERGVVQVKSLKTGNEQAVTLDEACALIAAGV
ncbi:MAG TPA: histidine--tRNA ligase [Elusimicrobiota bacterium]|jgi:histidyl-tRNA synthetase|nr:histidine--tRNA ligase [Elusimicrobiota bacterium]